MENGLVLTLAALAEKYFKELKSGGVECRLVIPALTESIAIDLQSALLAKDLPSYLVIPETTSPDAAKRWIRAEAVTSVRQGDMVVAVWPGEMSRIQDSVIGVGGAMRNFAFGDEWPWIDGGNEYFRFDGPVLSDLLTHWSIDVDDELGFKHVIEMARAECRDSMMRGQVFLDQMLGGYDPQRPAELKPIQRLLFHFGVPRSTSFDFCDKAAANTFFKSVRSTIVELDRRLKEVGGKPELLNRIDEIEPQQEHAMRLKSSLTSIIDLFTRRGDDKQQGILALRGCWKDLDTWRTWDLEALQRLLDVSPSVEKVDVKVEVSTDAGAITEDAKTVVLLDGGRINLRITYKGLAAGSAGAKVIARGRGRAALFEQECSASDGVCETSISFDQLFDSAGSSKKRSLRITVERADRILASGRVNVVPCGPNQPLVAIVEPVGKIIVGRDSRQPSDPGDVGESVEVNEPASLIAISWDSFADGELEIDGEVGQLQRVDDNPKVLRSTKTFDPAANGAVHTSVALRASGLAIDFDVEAKEIVRGEFTLERELVMQLARFQRDGKSSSLRRILDVFSGKATRGYSGLGDIDESSKSRRRFAQVFERSGSQGRPIIANLLSENEPIQIIEETQICFFEINELPYILKGATISSRVQERVNSYVEERNRILSAIRAHVENDSQWPDYAYIPVFSLPSRFELETLLASYLGAYISALDFVSQNIDELSWPELFRVIYSDCVVHWDGAKDPRKIILLGPWHPITVAKRFMVQSALVASARRHASGTTNGKSQMSALLLDQVNSLRWFSGLADDGKTFENFYVSATSDPGWLGALSHGVIGENRYLSVAESLRHVHGLEMGVVPTSRELVAKGYLQDFYNAFPTRRAISVVADASYDPSRLVESAQGILYDGDEPSEIGRQIPGGIHILVPDASTLETQEWRDPPICVYEGAEELVSEGRFNDVHLISPGKATTARDTGGDATLPRGSGLLAAFCAPVKEVGISANGSLQSRAFERDRAIASGATLGERFAQACRILGDLPREERVVSWEADLPGSLDHLWTVIPGNHVDPAVFVKYVMTAARNGSNAALWDYRMSLTGALNSYFVLSHIPNSVSHELNKSPVLQGKPLAPDVLAELGRVGMALGGESLRSGSRALGVIGVVAAVRLFFPSEGALSPLKNDGQLRGFLLPVDSFQEILDGSFDGADFGPRQRADLVAVQLAVLEGDMLGLSFSAIECKYTSNGFTKDQIEAARQQADATLRRLNILIDAALTPDGIPERLVFLALLTFGLRLSKELVDGSKAEQATLEAKILQLVLNGRIKLVPPVAGSIVVVTDCIASEASYTLGQGLSISLAPGHWPGISESPALLEVRDKLSKNFSALFGAVNSVIPFASEDAGQYGATDDGAGDRTEPPHSRDCSGGQGSMVEAASATQIGSAVSTGSGSADNANISRLSTSVGALKPILLGTAGASGYFYAPQNSERPLDNYNVMVTGSSGKGKTQLIKTLVCRLREQGRNVLLLDFKNDFASDQHFLETAKLHAQYVSFDGLPFNPLIPVPLKRPNSESEYLPVSEHINGLVDILRGTFNLGDQQEVAVKNAIRESFEGRGIPSRGAVSVTPGLDFPDFNEVGDKLESLNQNAYNRLDPLFDLGIFPVESRLRRFDAMLDESYVVDLSKIQSDRIKNAVAKILVMSAHRFYNAREHSGTLRQFFVFDEAHRVLDSEFVLQFVRECRAYGVGVVLSSQYPTDFPADISASLNTKFLHGNGADKGRVRDIEKLVGGSLPEEQVERLSMFQAILTNSQYEPVIIRTIGYPMMLVLDAIAKAGVIKRQDLAVPGVNADRLNLEYLVSALMEMGIVEETGAGLRVLEG